MKITTSYKLGEEVVYLRERPNDLSMGKITEIRIRHNGIYYVIKDDCYEDIIEIEQYKALYGEREDYSYRIETHQFKIAEDEERLYADRLAGNPSDWNGIMVVRTKTNK